MMRRALVIVAVLTLPAWGCGGGGGTTGDADADAVDGGHEVDATLDPSTDPEDDPSAEPAEDPVDVPDDADDDSTTDPLSDPVVDPTSDAPDVVADGRCPAMRAAFTSVESWVICWMGTGTAVSFTLQYDSPTSACSFTNVTVTGGSLDVVSSATSIMTWGTTASTSGFSGTVPAGGTASATYLANDTTLDSSAHDGASVTVTVEVSYDTPYSTEALTITSRTTTHTCVY
ncbi:MAG: hypothetical protein JRG91_13190 [Deltaproteobacteria bacterium]|nr:hypothetical protein [Deltaproteobacteria bacterium]